ncbi:SRPBCC family protein [Pseudorhodoferax sp.]|uniref:SRPBCC family protein n=1 Tax=Pseudorhodoferax sp. TaxID=1993553 RepID=UPI0039E47D2E
MSDHIDGPRTLSDPPADISDLFAFTSPEDPSRTVVALDVFPGAGADAVFSNAIDHAIAIRRVTVAGTGDAAKFQAGDQDLVRFSCRFGGLERAGPGAKPVQRGTCTLPDGRTLTVTVNDEKGTATPDGVFRIFAGLRSDPFYLAVNVGTLQKLPNLLLHDNVLAIVIEFDTRRVLDPDKGSLFGVVAETVPLPRPGIPVGPIPARIDWIGRPEQTNIRLNPIAKGGLDLRDLWNQQTPFAIAPEVAPLFRQRLKESFERYDMMDGRADWSPAALAANVNVFFDDFLLFDVSKPITDASHLEIEKSTINGQAYRTGGGRTVDANCIDILMTWLVNKDREFLQGGATSATKPGMQVFPYLATPNTELQVVVESVDLAAPPGQVWALLGRFDAAWHPLVAQVRLAGSGVGQLRTVETIDGKTIVERLEAMDDARRSYRYAGISGVPASDYTGTLTVSPKGAGSTVEWRAQFRANDQATLIVRLMVATLLKVGVDSLPSRFGAME